MLLLMIYKVRYNGGTGIVITPGNGVNRIPIIYNRNRLPNRREIFVKILEKLNINNKGNNIKNMYDLIASKLINGQIINVNINNNTNRRRTNLELLRMSPGQRVQQITNFTGLHPRSNSPTSPLLRLSSNSNRSNMR